MYIYTYNIYIYIYIYVNISVIYLPNGFSKYLYLSDLYITLKGKQILFVSML